LLTLNSLINTYLFLGILHSASSIQKCYHSSILQRVMT